MSVYLLKTLSWLLMKKLKTWNKNLILPLLLSQRVSWNSEFEVTKKNQCDGDIFNRNTWNYVIVITWVRVQYDAYFLSSIFSCERRWKYRKSFERKKYVILHENLCNNLVIVNSKNECFIFYHNVSPWEESLKWKQGKHFVESVFLFFSFRKMLK